MQKLRENKVKGQMVRAHLQWLDQGEKPTSFFCKLETKNYVDKIIKRIQTPDGSIITEQSKILQKVQEFYSKLFDNKENSLKSMATSKIPELQYFKKIDSSNLGREISTDKLGKALKKMKNNKSPGIDGISADFLKVFWGKLKYHIKMELTTHMLKVHYLFLGAKSIITCLPKDNKPRQFLKNWRPISLLCAVYKLISGVIAERIKPCLDKIISKSQTGFIKGRCIGENIRTVYDLMHLTEKKKIPGLLMLIDFEKAFDSVSWNFLYSTLALFGFDEAFISWIKLFNNNMTAFVLQCGVLSDPIHIGRGCRQGDPISPYLFLLVAEVLNILIENNIDIRGICVGAYSFKMTQFADDTTLLLDGSQKSLQTALNILELFGSLSGLKMNTEKTKMVWIGSREHCREKLNISADLQWGDKDFSVLGINFSVNLDTIPELNFNIAMNKAKQLLNCWNSRYLTPIGRITVIKTMVFV